MLHVASVDEDQIDIAWKGDTIVPVRVPRDVCECFRGQWRYILAVGVDSQCAYLEVGWHPHHGDRVKVGIPVDLVSIFMKLLTDKDRPR